jgi:hypothetical protein
VFAVACITRQSRFRNLRPRSARTSASATDLESAAVFNVGQVWDKCLCFFQNLNSVAVFHCALCAWTCEYRCDSEKQSVGPPRRQALSRKGRQMTQRRCRQSLSAGPLGDRTRFQTEVTRAKRGAGNFCLKHHSNCSVPAELRAHRQGRPSPIPCIHSAALAQDCVEAHGLPPPCLPSSQ